MTYCLIQLAPGAYDLLLHDTVVASVARNGSRQPYTWTAELLEDLPRSRRPAPFREIEHGSVARICFRVSASLPWAQGWRVMCSRAGILIAR
jgi:hypothetical protein